MHIDDYLTQEQHRGFNLEIKWSENLQAHIVTEIPGSLMYDKDDWSFAYQAEERDFYLRRSQEQTGEQSELSAAKAHELTQMMEWV